MKILLSCVPYDHGRSGISVCMREQATALRAAGHELTLIVEADAAESFSGYSRIVLPRWAGYPIFSMLYHLFLLPLRIRKAEFDFCLLCAANRRAFAFYPHFTVAVVHDLSQYHIKAKYDMFRMFYIQQLLPFFVRRADMVVTISHSTENDLKRFWRLLPDKIQVIPNGLSLSPVDETSGHWRCKLRLTRPYLLYISRLEHPGKNHIRLLKAFELLPEDIARKFDLVMPGALWEGAEPIFKVAKQSRWADHFHFPGFIDPRDLREAYTEASGYIFPSLYEGFGLSLIEAMHYEVPCACSSTSALGEIGEGCALLFNPESPEEIARAMLSLLTDQKGNKERIAAGKRRAAQFTWKNNVETIVRFVAERQSSRPLLFGVPVDTVPMDTALAQIASGIAKSRLTGRCSVYSFVNAHCLNIACGNPVYRRVLKKSDAVWPDGSGIRIAGRIMGFAVPENVNGTDLFPHLCEGDFTMFLLGARPGIAEKAMEQAAEQHPGVKIIGVADGYFHNSNAERRVINRINTLNPDILLVAMGVPKQELWISAHREELHCGVAIAVGGLFDFVSGRIPRAPLWLRRLGMEWCYRLYQEPIRLFRRYIFGNPLFLFRVLCSRFHLLKLRGEDFYEKITH